MGPDTHVADSDVSAFILAGGKSTRMGTDKAFVMLNGRTLLELALDSARAVTPNVYIAGDPAKFAAFAPVIEDVFPGCGPLAGIHGALRASKSDLNLILAVDTPFVTPALLRYFIERARSASSAIVTVARSRQGWQPLCAVYRREFAQVAENALRAGRYKIDPLFGQNTQVITEEDLEAAGISPEVFRNLNTPEELSAALKDDH